MTTLGTCTITISIGTTLEGIYRRETTRDDLWVNNGFTFSLHNTFGGRQMKSVANPDAPPVVY